MDVLQGDFFSIYYMDPNIKISNCNARSLQGVFHKLSKYFLIVRREIVTNIFITPILVKNSDLRNPRVLNGIGNATIMWINTLTNINSEFKANYNFQ